MFDEICKVQFDPHRQDSMFFHQSVNLYATYHYLEMQIHRRPLNEELAACASLEKCTSAATQCARVLAAGLARGLCVLPNILVCLLAASPSCPHVKLVIMVLISISSLLHICQEVSWSLLN